MLPAPLPERPEGATTIAGRYRLDRQIARGGMAEVWLGTDTFLNRKVAVKVLKPQLAADPTVSERFRREAVACAALNHPNIVAVYDSVEDDGRQAVVMQFVQGKSLRELLDRRGRLGAQLVTHMGAAIAAALDAAHRAGIVHRDVKPGNILLTPEGRFLLADFGIAKALSVAGTDLTNDNIMMGTAKYLSPEQVRGKVLDGRADLYGLGLVLYECLAGCVPFTGDNDAETALARLQRDPTDLAHLQPHLSPQLVRVVHRLLARNPEHRYATGEETRAALMAAASGRLDVTTRMTPPTGTDAPTRDATAPERHGDAPDESPVGADPSLGTPPHRQRASDAGAVAAIPGQPVLTTRRADTPVRPRRVATPRPATPAGGGRITLVLATVAGLLAVAVGVATVRSFTRSEAAAPAAVATAAEPVTILRATSYDPGGDAQENEALVPALLDADPQTAWTTECYADQYLGRKGYVGVLLELSAASAGTLEVAMRNGPWAIEVYGATEAAPPTLEGWGPRLGSDYNTRRGRTSIAVTTPVRHLLVALRQVGTGAKCGARTPHQGVMTGLTFVPATPGA
jgi:serine/threonine-protein kinase